MREQATFTGTGGPEIRQETVKLINSIHSRNRLRSVKVRVIGRSAVVDTVDLD